MKKVLLTGATGFIGRHCLQLLAEQGYQVHAVTSKPVPADKAAGVTWHQADLLDSARVSELVSTLAPTHLLHLAWYVEPKTYRSSPENLRWVQASLDLLRQFSANGGKRVVMAGTCFEYDWRYGFCSEPVTPLASASLYGTCKNSLQAVLMSASGQLNFSAAWGRIFFLYGPFEHPDRLVSSVTLSLLRGQPAPCTHGNQLRDFLYVKDVAAAFVALLDSEVTGPVNIASGLPVALKEIILTIARKINRADLVRLGAIPVSELEPPLVAADTRRLNNEVGWRPGYDLEHGLTETIRWWEEYLAGTG